MRALSTRITSCRGRARVTHVTFLLRDDPTQQLICEASKLAVAIPHGISEYVSSPRRATERTLSLTNVQLPSLSCIYYLGRLGSPCTAVPVRCTE